MKSTKVFQGESKWSRSAYLSLEDNKVVFDCSDQEYGPIEFDLALLHKALSEHMDKLQECADGTGEMA
jgi:hypothetical protein